MQTSLDVGSLPAEWLYTLGMELTSNLLADRLADAHTILLLIGLPELPTVCAWSEESFG